MAYDVENYMYRFRRLEQILGEAEGYGRGFDELRKQTIYFSPPEALNDPLEGLRDIFWSGDQIIWRNLLRHYISCVSHVFSLFLVVGETSPLNAQDIPVYTARSDLPTDALKQLNDRIYQRFFTHQVTAHYPESLANRQSPVRSNELIWHLNIVHPYALKCIHEEFTLSGLMKSWGDSLFARAEQQLDNARICDILNELEPKNDGKESDIHKIMERTAQLLSEQRLLAEYENRHDTLNRNLLLIDFPQKYAEQLESLIHPLWYTACFTSNYHNSSMWGNYAENHQGICLKFRNNPSGEKPFLTLHCKNGYGGRKGDMRALYGKTPHSLHQIDYQAKHPPIDFFKSIGKLSIPRLNETWFFDERGNKSIYHDAVFKSEEQWRAAYWESFYQAVTTKTKDWAYECEHRLILAPMMLDYSSVEDRCITYDFSDLEGVIFGIKTPQDKKLAIMRIIDEKCTAARREDFKFYQAYYCSDSGKIQARELSLVKPALS